MNANPAVAEAAKRQGQDNIYNQFTSHPGDRIRAHRVVDLLVAATSPAAQPGARELLRQMGIAPWKVIANVHPSGNDPTAHITVEVCGKKYHLRLDARGCVFDITSMDAGKTERLSGHRPWVRPGAI